MGCPGASLSVPWGQVTCEGLLRGAEAAGPCGLCAESGPATWAGQSGAAAGWTDAGLEPKGTTAWATGLMDPERGQYAPVLEEPGPRGPLRTWDKLSPQKGRGSQTPQSISYFPNQS